MARHRGPNPKDPALFHSDQWALLRNAVDDLCWLLTRGYPRQASLQLVGNRYNLRERQRVAVGRTSCSDRQSAERGGKSRPAGPAMAVDGFNVITTLEAALSGGVLLLCRDSAVRDMASMHGSYKRVEETPDALGLVARCCPDSELLWYLDQPVSNSGRLRQMILNYAQENGLDWRVELVKDPDPILKKCELPVITSDSAILDEAQSWFNLAGDAVERFLPDAWVVS